MQKSLRTVFFASVALFALVLSSSLTSRLSFAQTKPHVKAHQGSLAEPLLTGSDGSQTGIAKFQGNLTAITAPPGQALVLSREPDCSLSLFTGTVALTSQLTYTSTGFFADYDQVLHANAGLTSTPGAFTGGCVPPSNGLSSHRGVFVGQTTKGLLVFASVYFNPALSNNALLVSSGNTSFNSTSLSFAAAGALTTADLNGDGNGDLVVVNGNNGGTATAQIFVLLGNPDGTFQTAVPYAVPGNASISAVVDDINGDGKLDIIASSDNGQISIFTGNGDGTFNSAQSFAAPTPVYPGSTVTPSASLTNLITANLRGAGKKDIIASNGLVLLNDGSGNFTAASSAAFPPPLSNSSFGPNLAAGDLNKDGKLDLVVSLGGSVLTYLGNSDGTFSPGAGYATINTDGFVNVSDLDGDGNLDIYIGEANGGFYFGDDIDLSYALMGNGDGTFQGAPIIPGAYTGTNLGDINGDGIPDLISNATDQFNQTLPTFTVQLGTGKGTFTSTSTIVAPASFTGTTSALTSPVTIINADTVGATSYAVADVNGDGKADLVFVDNGLGAINAFSGLPITYPAPIYFVALSNGDGTFATPVPYNFPQIAPASGFDVSVTANTVQIADFNHDGHPDLLFTYNEQGGGPGTVPYNQGFAILTGKGDGTFSTTAILTPTYSSTSAPTNTFVPTVLSTVDLNGDGKPDLIVNGPGTVITNSQLQTATQIYIGNGDGTFKTPTTIPAADEYGIPVVADFNKDGKLDLAFLAETSAAQAELVVALGNGDGTFGTATIFNVGGGDAIRSSGLAAADFDGDGNVDLALIDGADFSGIFYGKGDGTFPSVPFNGNAIPKDLINLVASGSSIALDLNKDGKPDILAGNTVLLNTYATAPTVVTQFNTTTAVSTSSNSITQGSSVTFTATVAPASGSTGTPTGSVLFADGDLTIGSGTVDSTGKATFTTTALAAGSHNITAGFAGSTTFFGSVSSTVGVTVGPAVAGIATTTTLTPSATTAVSGASITFTATVTPASGTAVPTGTVTFSDSGTAIGTGTLDPTGKATFSITALAIGSHSITASYGGATTPTAFSNSASSTVSVTITNPPIISTTTALTASATTATSGTSITFTAAVTPASGSATPTGTITFNDGSTALGTGTLDGTGKATLATTALTVGSHTITAAYGGATAFDASTSTGVAITITATTPDFTLSLSPTSASVARGATVGSMLTITGGANQSYTLTCTGAPANSNCSVGSALALANGNTSATIAVVFNAFVTTTSSLHRAGNIEAAAVLPFGLIGSIALFVFGRRRSSSSRWSLPLIAVIGMGLLAITGCGGGGNKSTTTDPATGTYPLTITVTGGAISHTATFTVTVQ
jgi:Bacterial Ig-like domain (group 3)/FG-GAP-like repeat